MEADLERVAQEQRRADEEKERNAAANAARLAKEAADIAMADEAAQRKYYTEKYKLYPFIKFKNFLKKNGIAKAEVDHCLDTVGLTPCTVGLTACTVGGPLSGHCRIDTVYCRIDS